MEARVDSMSYFKPAISGFFILFLALGIGRFAYTPLLPVLVQQHWMSHLQAGFLGATNLAGYFAGAVLARHIIKFWHHQRVIYFSAALSIISLFACAWHLGLVWLNIWRLIAGIAAAFMMVLTPSVIFHAVSQQYKGRVGGIMFSGVGFASVCSGIFIPYLVKYTVSIAWLFLGGFSLLAAMVGLGMLPNIRMHQPNRQMPQEKVKLNFILIALLFAYMLYGIGGMPQSLFIVGYIANHLHFGNHLGGYAWSLFGFGMLCLSPLLGYLADK